MVVRSETMIVFFSKTWVMPGIIGRGRNSPYFAWICQRLTDADLATGSTVRIDGGGAIA
jgi:hypothetical protein